MTTSTAITEKFVELGHGKTRYFEAGTGYPTILIHGAGFLSGADGWLGVMGQLAERGRVLSIDCLNWGPGDVFDQEFSFAYLVDHVREFMDAMGIEKANIVGHTRQRKEAIRVRARPSRGLPVRMFSNGTGTGRTERTS